MKFIDRVKRILLEKKEEELAAIEEKIQELERKHSEEQQNVEELREQSKQFLEQKKEVQKNILTKKDLEELEILYNFLANYSRIEKIIELIKRIKPMKQDWYQMYLEDINLEELINNRQPLCDCLKDLNKQILEINDEDIQDIGESKIQEKRSIFFRIFSKREKTIFAQYRKTVENFRRYYDRFLALELEDQGIIDYGIIDRITCVRINNTIKQLLALKRKGVELIAEDEEFLEKLRPHELWDEMYQYYTNTELILEIVQKFESKIDRFEEMYIENPSLFDLETLERILEENNRMIIDFKSKNKQSTSKNSQFAKQKQSEKEIRLQLQGLQAKKRAIIENTRKIQQAKTLSELGYKNKQDAAKKLSIETKDYIVIPIPNNIGNISDLFNQEKQLKVEVEGKTFLTMYSNDAAIGKINAIDSLKEVNGVIMIPIALLRRADIDNINTGKISLNKSVLELEDIILILPNGKHFEIGNINAMIIRYSSGKINEQVKKFLGEDYEEESSDISNYDIFKNVSNTSDKERKLKREAVKKCLFENIKRDIHYTDIVLVNGKSYFLSQEDEKDLYLRRKLEPVDEEKLIQMANEIETYLIEDGNNPSKIDDFYQMLLLEYMRVNRKAKAEYQDEDDTIVDLKGKRVSIKPPLFAKDETIAKRYSRRTEDIIYKTMKLANLVNRFAHLAEANSELQNILYDIKLDLIENAIDLAKDNPNVKLRRRFDEQKMVMSVILEIPGYNMIALHIRNKGDSLLRKSNQLEEHQYEVLQTSAIIIPGVNKELLMALKKMSIEERIQTLLDMDSNVFYKFVLRMGYDSENISSEDKKSFIRSMVSDKKIDELLKGNDELEK